MVLSLTVRWSKKNLRFQHSLIYINVGLFDFYSKGDHYYGTKRVRSTGKSKKVNCPATLQMMEVLVYKDYPIDPMASIEDNLKRFL